MRTPLIIAGLVAAAAVTALQAAAQDRTKGRDLSSLFIGTERAKEVPLPPGFQVVATELDGPVFADARGKTLYKWQLKPLRNGSAGERKNEPACYDTKTTETAGLMSPYPAGLVLPELETRPACTDVWKPVYAPAEARPIERWTTLPRKDGMKQWAYDGFALYTSVLDTAPGEVAGAPKKPRGDSPSFREPVKPPSDVPFGFEISTTA